MELAADILSWLSTAIVLLVIGYFTPGMVRFARGCGRYYDPLRALFLYLLAVRLWYQSKNYAWPHQPQSSGELISQIAANVFSLIGVGLMCLLIVGYEKIDDSPKS